MTDIKNKDKILQAIDELRRRKARPDIDRISGLVFRRFGIVAKDTRMELEKMVDAEIVIKVDYKGSTSYRNAAKWSKYAMYKGRAERSSSGSSAIHSILTRAFASLLVDDPDYLDFGVPRVELERMMLQDDPLTDLTEIDLILAKALTCRFLVELSNGNYSLADHPVPSTPSPKSSSADDSAVVSVQPSTSFQSYDFISDHKTTQLKTPVKDKKPNKEPLKSTEAAGASQPPTTPKIVASTSAVRPSTSSSVDSSKSDVKVASLASISTELGAIHIDGQRVGVRRKTAKKVFDPSDNYAPTRKRGRPPASVSNSKKDVKQSTVKCCLCKKVSIEKMVQCRDCSNRAHLFCILGKRIDKKKPQLNIWVCPICKLCAVCFEPRINEALVVCINCGESYHARCHNPPITEDQKNNKWSCASCGTQRPTAENRSQPAKHKLIDKKFQSFIPKEETPDATNWTVDQVCKYLEDHGCAAQAVAFRHHEIDGRSLLMLKRHDVLYEMGLKAGPALKVYHFVQLLQVKDIKKVFPFNEMLR